MRFMHRLSFLKTRESINIDNIDICNAALENIVTKEASAGKLIEKEKEQLLSALLKLNHLPLTLSDRRMKRLLNWNKSNWSDGGSLTLWLPFSNNL